METARTPASALAGSRLASDTVQAPALLAVIDQLERRLTHIAEGVNRAEDFSQRLIDPRPSPVARDSNNKVSGAGAPTIEGRIRSLVQLADSLGDRLNGVCAEFDRAA